MAQTFALIASVLFVLQQVSCGCEMIPDAPKYYGMHRNISLGPTGWIGCIRCEKSRRDFAAPTFALIAQVLAILHRVSCNNEIVPNAPKHYETQQNMSLASNGVDRVHSLRKIET